MTIFLPLNPREPHNFELADDQPSWAPEGGYCRCGWIQDARVHRVAAAEEGAPMDENEV